MPTRQCGHGMSEAAGMEGGVGGSGGSHMERPASGWARPRNGCGGDGRRAFGEEAAVGLRATGQSQVPVPDVPAGWWVHVAGGNA